MSQTNQAEAKLRAMIIDMELGPGEALSERGAEALLGASRTPIRAALQRLEAEGLVRRDGRGWIVAPLDVREIEQLFVYRELLETGALQLAARSLHACNFQALDELLAMTGGPSKQEMQSQGTDFHLRLVELAGNTFVTRSLADTLNRLSRARWLDIEGAHSGWTEHEAIVAALKSGDPDLAIAILRRHIQDSRGRVVFNLTSRKRSLRASGSKVLE